MMKPLYETYRPTTWNDLVGQDHVVKAINALCRRGLAGRAIWLVGDSGTGKTTIARLIADEIADPFAIDEMDAQDMNFDRIREIERICHMRPLGKGYWVFIINEAYGMVSWMFQRLLTTLEDPAVQKTSTWIFTATRSGEAKMRKKDEASALLSRCIRLELNDAAQLREPFAARCREIAQAEGLDGKPMADYLTLADDCQCNFREMLQRVDAGQML